jgi:hypothetical protein
MVRPSVALRLASIRTGMNSTDKACLTLAHQPPLSDDDMDRVIEIFQLFDPEFLKHGTAVNVKWHGYLSMIFSNTLFQVLHGQVIDEYGMR